MITEKIQINNEAKNKFFQPLSRRNILGIGSTAAATLLAAVAADAQQQPATKSKARLPST